MEEPTVGDAASPDVPTSEEIRRTRPWESGGLLAWEHSETQWTELTDRSMDRTEDCDSLNIGSGSFFKAEEMFATFEWDSLGDGYYTRSEVREFAELVAREREEQRNIELSTEHVRKWIKCAVQSPPPRVLPLPACG